MANDEDPKSTMTARERGALAVAVAALTVALGLTFASVADWRMEQATPAAADAVMADAVTADAVQRAASTERVVLVPVSPVSSVRGTEPAADEEHPASHSGRDDRDDDEDDDEDDDDHHDDDDRHRDHDDDDGWLAFADEGGESHD